MTGQEDKHMAPLKLLLRVKDTNGTRDFKKNQRHCLVESKKYLEDISQIGLFDKKIFFLAHKNRLFVFYMLTFMLSFPAQGHFYTDKILFLIKMKRSFFTHAGYN